MARRRKKLRPGARSVGTTPKRVGVRVDVRRDGRRQDFEACAYSDTRTRRASDGYNLTRANNMACARGRNPRKAIGRALQALGRQLAVRKGAYAGYRKGGR